MFYNQSINRSMQQSIITHDNTLNMNGDSSAHLFKYIDLWFCVSEPVEGAHVRSDPSPHELFEGTTLTLSCSITKGSHVSYTWFFNGRPVVDGIAQNTMSVHNTTITDSGDYVCFASNAVENTSIYTSNSSTSITIKGHLLNVLNILFILYCF